MWGAVALAVAVLFFFQHIKRKTDVAKKAGEAYMLGFHWGDSVDAVAKWAKRLGLRYQNASNEAACIVYTGRFPGLLQPVSYTFHLPGGFLDSIAILAEDAAGISFDFLREKFTVKCGEAWDEDDDNLTWIAGDAGEILLVLFQGRSGYAHVRFFNMENLGDKDLDEEHDKVIEAIRMVDAEIIRQNEERKKKQK